jgi:hypothetical protein
VASPGPSFSTRRVGALTIVDLWMADKWGEWRQMASMNENVDVCVCHPDVGINTSLEAVFIQFEVMDRDTQEGTGKSHTVLMPMPDAMWLLRHLENIQQKYSLPKPAGEFSMVELSESKKKN